MAPGEIPLPPAGVDVADLVFEYGQMTLACRGGRDFVARERRAVLARAGPQVSYRLVQSGGVGVSERERLLVVGDGVAVGVQAPRVASCQPMIQRGLLVLASQPVVAGYLAREGVRLAPARLPR